MTSIIGKKNKLCLIKSPKSERLSLNDSNRNAEQKEVSLLTEHLDKILFDVANMQQLKGDVILALQKRDLEHELTAQQVLLSLLPVMQYVERGLGLLGSKETEMEEQRKEINQLRLNAASVSTRSNEITASQMSSELKKSQKLVSVLQRQLDRAMELQRDAQTEAEIATSKLEAALWHSENLKRNNEQLLETISSLKGTNEALQNEKDIILKECVKDLETQIQCLTESTKRLRSDSNRDRATYKDAFLTLTQKLDSRERDARHLNALNHALTTRASSLVSELKQLQRQQDKTVTVISPVKFSARETSEIAVQTDYVIPNLVGGGDGDDDSNPCASVMISLERAEKEWRSDQVPVDALMKLRAELLALTDPGDDAMVKFVDVAIAGHAAAEDLEIIRDYISTLAGKIPNKALASQLKISRRTVAELNYQIQILQRDALEIRRNPGRNSS